jgi:hypothetical protein
VAHQTHDDHDAHVHGPGCGHESVQHGDECEVEEEVEELATDEAAVRRVASGKG